MKYFRNTSWLFGEKILRMVVGLFVGVWIARYLGPEQYGLLSYAGSFVGLFTIVATLGLDSIVVRELVMDKTRHNELLGTAFYLKLMGAFGVLTVLAITVVFTSNDTYTNTLVFIIASATVFQSLNVIDFYFQSRVLSRYIAYANFISLFFSSVVKIILILMEAPLVAFAWVVLFDSFVLAMGFLYFYRHNHLSLRAWRFEKSTAELLLKESWPLILSGSVLIIQSRIDQVMLKEMAGNTEVGYYSVALKLIEVFGFIPMLLKSTFFPSIQHAKKTSEALYQNRLLNFYRLNFLLFLLIATPIFIFAEPMVVLLYGNAYQSAGILLALMAVRLFFTNMGVARSAYILSENLLKFSLITMVLGTVANIVLNYFWIESYGAKGAIAATIVSFTVTVFLVDIFHTKARQNVFMLFNSMVTFYKLRLEK
ncbi:flippase [Sulfurovum sp.]|uniref:flippase n=1 Tax=Sulfurovum sp. TaxID=1969726 RepID=UPI003568D239